MDLISTDRQTLQAAQRAFDAWKQSLETGDEQAFAAVVADNVRFVVNLPYDQWRGEHQGRARVEELLRFERDELKLRSRITLLNVLANGNRVAFEWSVERMFVNDYYERIYPVRGLGVSKIKNRMRRSR